MQSYETFFREKINKIFTDKKRIIDIGGGLRVSKKSGNRYDPKQEWITPLLANVEYKILDPVPDYNPDFVGDIHNLPFGDNSQEAILCIAVLEHVENPIRAVSEMHRVLKDGGYCFIYVPFLYYYHAERGYYKDYWRFTRDSLDILFKDFSTIEARAVRGAISTWAHLSPLGKFKAIVFMANFFDSLFGKNKSNQVSGYYVFLVK